MTLPAPSFRTFAIVAAAAAAGLALWLFQPWGGASSWNGLGTDGLPPSIKVDGAVQVESTDNVITRLIVPLALRGEDGGIVLTDGTGKLRAETSMSETAAAAVPATYTLQWLEGDGDATLEPGERAQFTVDLPEHTSVHPSNPLRLVLKPASGDPLYIENIIGD